MSMALLLALLLPIVQDDPQVMYREGLFEEVDQGNLEKAAELYGKILKSGAPDALKAKALLRTGFCHEKKGRKKEAEQAWRDVIERYPAAAETVKLARERLSRPEDGSSPRSTDDQIQIHIFNLGNRVDDGVRLEARRMLLFLGESSVPYLQKALQNRDRMVSEGTALVLYEMELRDGLYEALHRFWGPKGDLTSDALELLPKLLESNEAARKKFLKDAAVLMQSPNMPVLAPLLCSLPEPEFHRIVEDWIVKAGATDAGTECDAVLETWIVDRPSSDVARMMKRLSSTDPPATGIILKVFHLHAVRTKSPDAALKKACLEALQDAPPGTDYYENLRALLPYFTPSELVRGPIATWMVKRPEDDKRLLLHNIANLPDQDSQLPLSKENRKFLFEQLAAAEVPLATKELILASGFNPDTPEERTKFLAYCLHFWKEQGTKGERNPDVIRGVLAHLAYYLPPDSKELPAILDAAFDIGASYPGMWGERPEERRPLVIEAMHRSLKRNETTRDRVLGNLGQYGSPEEKLSIGTLLGELGPTRVGFSAGYTYAHGFHALEPSIREARWKDVAAYFESGTPGVKSGLVQGLAEMDFGPVDELMKKELTSSVVAIRQSAIRHWGNRRGPEALKQLSIALNDRHEPNQRMAIGYLQATPSLEAVPEIIKLLNSPSREIRELARTTLVEFKQHFAAQAEWQRWYDETKKSLGK